MFSNMKLSIWLVIVAFTCVVICSADKASTKKERSIRTSKKTSQYLSLPDNSVKESGKGKHSNNGVFYKSKRKFGKKRVSKKRIINSLGVSLACIEKKSSNEKRRSAELVFTGRVEWFNFNNEKGDKKGKNRRMRRQREILAGISVKTILRGGKELEGRVVKMEGFNNSKVCHSKIRVKDSRIFFASKGTHGNILLHSSPLRMTLKNLQLTEHLVEGRSFPYCTIRFRILLIKHKYHILLFSIFGNYE